MPSSYTCLVQQKWNNTQYELSNQYVKIDYIWDILYSKYLI